MQQKNLRGLIALLIGFGVGFGVMEPVAFSDMQVTPKGASAQDGSWGDPSEGSKMLQMTKDPEVVHTPTAEERDHLVPPRSAPDCTDSAGNPVEGTGGRGCSIGSKSAPVPATGDMNVNSVAQPAPRSRLDGSPSSGGTDPNLNQGFTLTH